MKRFVYVAIGLLLLTTVSCKKQQIKKLEETIISGNWKITSFSEDGIDKTSNYTSETLTFKNDGTLTATGSFAINGTWDVRKEDDNDDDFELFDDKHIELNIYLPVPLSELSDDWEVESRSDSKIVLKDDSEGESDHTHRLTLEKIE
jgi:hypothetical protein